MSKNLTKVIEESFIQYSGAVLQSRALVDVRDAVKPSARQIFYAMHTDGFTYNKPIQKTIKAIGSTMRFYIHGDASCAGIIMRGAQDFATRYPLVEVRGNAGTLLESGDYAATRYTESRLSKLSSHLFQDIEKNAVVEWRDNYDETEQYPAVLPSKGFYNIVNGVFGIGVGASSSIPPTNLRETHEALIKLLWDPNTPFEDIYCAPDFPTGGVLLNSEEVKESMRTGQGKSCRIRSVVEYNKKENALIVTEIPYFVYTNTICQQLEQLIESEENPGVEKFIDLTKKKPLLKIYLNKGANPDYILQHLFKKTSLESFYGINLTMLKDGRYPTVYTWKSALLAYLEHQLSVYTRVFQYELTAAKSRLEIVEGFLKAVSILDEVVATIRASDTTKDALNALMKMGFSERQGKAILELRLARLVKLDISKYQREEQELLATIKRIETILESETLLKKEIEKDIQATIRAHGDERRTIISNIATEDAEEVVEEVQLITTLTNKGNLHLRETSTLYTRKGRAGVNLKLPAGEYVIQSGVISNLEKIYFFDEEGVAHPVSVTSLPREQKISVSNLLSKSQKIVGFSAEKDDKSGDFIIFISRKGTIKKSKISDILPKTRGAKVITLSEGDSIFKTLTVSLDSVVALTSSDGRILLFDTSEVAVTKRNSRGVAAMKLKAEEYIVGAFILEEGKNSEILTISENGIGKVTNSNEYRITSRNGKGVICQALDDGDSLASAELVLGEELLIQSKKREFRVQSEELSRFGRASKGSKIVSLKDGDSVKNITFL